MNLQEMELLTILCEPGLEERVIDVLRRAGAKGFSVSRSEGDPVSGFQMDVVEGANARIECVVRAETAARILDEVATRFMAHRSLVVWQSTVRVLRPDRFG